MVELPPTAQEAVAEGIEITEMQASFDALGRVITLLAAKPPFSSFDLGNLVRAVQHQLSAKCHVAATSNGRLIGYVGWMHTTAAIAEAWSAGTGHLTPAADGADAIAVTIVISPDRQVLSAMAKRARRLTRGKRAYYKRQYADRARPPRKASVANRL